MPSATKRREDRLEVRLTPKEKSMLKRAAAVERKACRGARFPRQTPPTPQKTSREGCSS
jgi:hypothetical protein